MIIDHFERKAGPKIMYSECIMNNMQVFVHNGLVNTLHIVHRFCHRTEVRDQLLL